MKTENMNSNTTMGGKRAYIKPYSDIIKLETNYGVMEDKSIAIDPNTPADGDGNAKQFDMSDDMWDDSHEEDLDTHK